MSEKKITPSPVKKKRKTYIIARVETPPPVTRNHFDDYEVESPPPTPETPTSWKGLCSGHTLRFQANYAYYCDPEMKGEKEMICYKCEQGCERCDCRWTSIQEELLTWAAEEYDFDDVDVGKITTKSVRFGCYKWYIHKIFGNDLGSGNRVMLPKCVVDGIHEFYSVVEGEEKRGFSPGKKKRNGTGKGKSNT